MKRFLVGALLAWLAFFGHAQAQGLDQALVVSSCGSPPVTYTAGQLQLPTVDTTGKLCLSGSGGSGGITVGAAITGTCPNGQVVFSNSGAIGCEAAPGTGTVTTFSVVTANGVSASVANPTTTPAATFTLGNITPSNVTIGAGAAITSSGAGGALGSNAFNSTAIPGAANPTATAGPAAVNGSATTFMRSDAAPLLQKGTNAQFGIVEGDTTTITCVAGVCTAVNTGTVTSVATGCGSSGGTITTTGTIIAAELVNLQTGANYAVVNGDCGKLVDLSNGSAQTPTIAQAGSGGNFTSGWFADVCNIGAGTQTLTPATSTINGASTLPIIKGQCYRVVSDGTNYQTSGSGTFGTTGSGNLVYATSPTLVTPVLGTPTSVTLNNTSDVIGGVTMTLGSDATGDIYYRSAGGVLTRLPVCTGTNVLGASGGLPACVAQAGGGTPGGSNTQVQYNNSSVFGGITNMTTDGTNITKISIVPAANANTILSTGYSITGSGTTSMLDFAGTLNTSGSPDVIALRITDTARGASTKFINLYGGASGTTTAFSVDNLGVVYAGDHTSGQPAVFLSAVRGSFVLAYGNGGGFATGTSVSLNGNWLHVTASRNQVQVPANSGYGWQSTNSDADVAADTILTRPAAAAIQHGAADSAAPVNQIIQVQGSRGGTDTNIGGGTLVIKSGNGTGTGTPSSITFQVPVGQTTGSVAQTQTAVLTLTGAANGSNPTITLTGVTTGTNADFLCLSSGGVVQLQTSACTISTLRVKPDWKPYTDNALIKVANMDVGTFHIQQDGHNADPNAYSLQAGLNAENIARVAPECAIYEDDMQTPKSYRQECVIALFVKAMQQQQAQINVQHIEINDLRKEIRQ